MYYETFFLKYFSGNFKKLQNIIACSKKTSFYKFDYFSCCSAHFWPLKSLKLRKCPYLSNCRSHRVLLSLILTKTYMFLYVFLTVYTSKMKRNAPNRKNCKNRRKWYKNCPNLISHEAVILETLFIFHTKWNIKLRICLKYVTPF